MLLVRPGWGECVTAGSALLLRSEAAEQLHVSESTVKRLVRSGAITEIKVGKRAVRIDAGLGRREKALAAIEEAVTIYRQLAHARPGAFLPNITGALRVLAHVLKALGRDLAAAEVKTEASALGG
jgi:excisionase family DNA binding protein